jgi:GNAT superfamily N-acetyltransferase
VKMAPEYEIRRARLEEIVDLRHAILRQGLPREAAIFEGDDAPSSRHYGAFVGNRIVCCVTLHRSEWESAPAWQLRGMATEAGYRQTGIGRAVMEFLEEDVRKDESVRKLMWCNARTPATGFYEKLGWRIVSERFEIPTAGPHVRMVKLPQS